MAFIYVQLAATILGCYHAAVKVFGVFSVHCYAVGYVLGGCKVLANLQVKYLVLGIYSNERRKRNSGKEGNSCECFECVCLCLSGG